ncbi:helix-turn-helix domain-containing protein [Sphingobacterium bambusae]|uniref:Helix-turn-helix domain-containing protein n=1 Tax=Sphingobacterium bambusae TaxID=662858 RepID=A0ABW6BKR8_9SPHI|nr:helix-turn-helix transcriptional regulator [Sphingobacterium bambusae]WPL51021.1 helix-turn-helix transcriptional regulator [Sphingobacterium bambusae]
MKEKYRDNFVKIGKNIRVARKESGLSQEELAARCETVNAAKISKMENAREDYNLATLLEVCDALEISVQKIMDGL